MHAGDRVDAYRALFALARAANCSPSERWAPDFTRVRVRLGTGLADYALPYAIHEDLQRTLDTSLQDLAFLYLRRHASLLGAHADRILLEDPGRCALRPESYTVPDGVQTPALRRLLEEAPLVLFDLDTGILASWLGSGGSGRRLMGVWTRALHTSFDEAARNEGREPTPLLLSWVMLRAGIESVEQVLRRKDLPPEVQDRLGAALRVTLYALQRALHQLLAEERPGDLEPQGEIHTVWKVLLNPQLQFAGAEAALARCPFYPAPARTLGEYEQTLREAFMSLQSFDVFLRSVSDVLRSEPALRSAAEDSYARASMRRNQLAVLGIGVSRSARIHQEVSSWLAEPARFAAVLADARARAELCKLLLPLARDARTPAEGLRVAALAQFITDYRPEDPLAALGAGRSGAQSEIASSLAADLADTHFAQHGRSLWMRFRPLTGSETDRDLSRQYEAGAVYVFGAAPILKQRAAAAQTGHYFIDLKDFTRRTALLKEEVMADFIREHFYLPILAIARSYHHGLPEMEDRGGVYLNNLLGDAISLSGDVVSLVQIARRIRRHLAAYAALLKARESDEDLARRTDAVRDSHEERQSQLRMRRAELEDRSQGGVDGEVARALAELGREEAELEQEIERDLAGVTGAELCAGSFIAYGAGATVLALDDPAWGNLRVSISEKLNESARGTERSGGVRRLVESELEAERRRGSRASLERAFAVHVRRPLTLPLPLEVEQRAHQALSTGDLGGAEAAFDAAVRGHLQEITSDGESSVQSYLQQGMSLYNAGDALSGEALDAYRKASSLQYVERSFSIQSLDPALRQRFALGSEPLRLILALDEGGAIREIFRYAGALVFKGFEAAPPSAVWEMIDGAGELGRALASSPRIRAALAQGNES